MRKCLRAGAKERENRERLELCVRAGAKERELCVSKCVRRQGKAGIACKNCV